MDTGTTANATRRTTPVWSSPLRIVGILLPLAAGLVCAFIRPVLLLVSWIPFTVAAVASGSRPTACAARGARRTVSMPGPAAGIQKPAVPVQIGLARQDGLELR